MAKFWRQKLITPLAAVLIALAAAGATYGITALATTQPQEPEPSIEQLYQQAVEDAVWAEDDEIMPLVELTPLDKLVTWDETYERVLLLSWHQYPESYPEGSEITLQWGEVWTFTDREIKTWYQQHNSGVSDWTLRLEQLIGLPPDSGYTHISAFWTKPEDVIRPAYITDTTEQMTTQLAEGADKVYREWFEDNIIWSYFDSAYPWTRLGYTYDWADNGQEYGLSEFLIRQGAEVEVAFTMTTEEFIDWLGEK